MIKYLIRMIFSKKKISQFTYLNGYYESRLRSCHKFHQNEIHCLVNSYWRFTLAMCNRVLIGHKRCVSRCAFASVPAWLIDTPGIGFTFMETKGTLVHVQFTPASCESQATRAHTRGRAHSSIHTIFFAFCCNEYTIECLYRTGM